MMEINIVLAPDNNYAKHAGVVIASVLRNASKDSNPRFWILDGGLSEANKDALRRVDAGRECEVNFVKISAADFENFPSMKYITVSTWYRLKAVGLLPESVKRFLYLDCDVVVCKDLSELFAMPMENCLVAGAIDCMWHRYDRQVGLPQSHRYFNAGVILVDAEAWRREGTEAKIFAWLKEDARRLKLMDQSVLNICVGDRYKELDIAYNLQYTIPFVEDTCYNVRESDILAYIRACESPTIIHYMSQYKPWISRVGEFHKFRDEYFKYLKFTNWRFESDVEEKNYHSQSSRLKLLTWIKILAIKLSHKPFLITRKLYWGRVYLEYRTRRGICRK